jgi:hypothetical protein
MLPSSNLKKSELTNALNHQSPSINSNIYDIGAGAGANNGDGNIFENIDLTSPKLFHTPKSKDGSNINLMEQGLIGQGQKAAIHMASSTARNALISPILAEKNNREHIAIILANCSKTIKYKAIYAIIALMASVSFACLWFNVLPANASNSAGSAFNILAIASGISMLAHSFINQLILWNIDTDFKAQARELIVGFNEGITKQQEANQELNLAIDDLNMSNKNLALNVDQLSKNNIQLELQVYELSQIKIEIESEVSKLKKSLHALESENTEFKKNNQHLKNSIYSLDGLIRNTTSEVSKWMDIALKEDEDSKQVLKDLKTQLLEAAKQTNDGYQVFLGVASNLQGVRKELSDLTNKNKALTKEYKEVLSQIITVQKQLKEQTFLDKLRHLARKVDHFADQGGRNKLEEAINLADENQTDNLTIPKSIGEQLQSFLLDLDRVMAEADTFSSIQNPENINHRNQPLCDYAERRFSEIEEPPTPR